jgi:hypothetical protein
MTVDTSKHGNQAGHGGFERQDLSAAGVIYFFLGLAAVTLLAAFLLTRFYDFLENRATEEQPALSPLITNVPTDTRHIPRTYPQSVFPNPKLEEDERGQLNGIRLTEEQTLNSYGWVDEKAGTIHIPIERAMDLLAQRGLPVRPAGTTSKPPAKAPDKKDKRENK